MTRSAALSPALSLDHGIQVWAAWLEGNRAAVAPLPRLPALSQLKRSFARTLGKQPIWTAHVFDWVFPADRYAADVSLERLLRMNAALGASDIRRLLDTPKVNEHLMRSFYALFLQHLNCTVDHHGWVATRHGPEHFGQQLAQLDEQGQRQVARVLRFLHLAGWRGFSYTGGQDPYDHSYSHGLTQALQTGWAAANSERPYPALWRNAVGDTQRPGSGQVLGLCLRRIKVLDATLYRPESN